MARLPAGFLVRRAYFRRRARRAASDPEAAETSGGQPPPVKPRLRGVSHRWAFFASLLAGGALVFGASSKRAIAATMVYALSLSGLFGVSALYHEVTWSVPVRRWMRRLDHSMIFLLIAGTYTPMGVLVLPGTLGLVVLTVVWGGAFLGIALNLVWIDAPKWLIAIAYISLGWVAVVTFPDLVSQLGATAAGVILLGGLLYSAGAAVYAFRYPDPVPEVFGYHEVFHALVIAAAVAHYAVVALYVLPRS
jgi:hemolysin III